MGKKLIYNIEKIFIMFTIMLMVGTVQVSAAEGDKSGKCGDNVTWTYDELTKTLSLDGNGATFDYENGTYSPWLNSESKFNDKIVNLKIGCNITRLGIALFANCTALQTVIVPDNVTSIGRHVFGACSSLEVIQLPKKVKLGAEIFQGCLSLKQIKGAWATEDGVLYDYDIDGYSLYCYPSAKEGDVLEIPEGATAIGAWALDECKYLKKLIIPQSVKKIYNHAVNSPKRLENILFRGNIRKFEHLSNVAIHNLPSGSTVTVRTQADKDALIDGLDAMTSNSVNIADVAATDLTFKDATTSEVAVVEPGGSYTPTIKLAPSDTTDQVTWSYESSDSVKSFDDYTGTIELNGNGKAVLTGRTGSGLAVTSEVFFYLPCDRNSLKISYDYAPRSLDSDDPDLAGTILRVPLSGRVNNFVANFKTNYYVDMWMNTDPVNAEGWRYSYAAERMSLEASNPEIIQFDSATGKITPKAVGTAIVTAKADDGPNGFITCSFIVEVVERNIHDCQIYNAKGDAYDVDKSWIKMEDKSELTIKDGVSVLVQGIDYKVSYENETPDSVYFRITGLGKYAGERLAYCQISKTPVNNGGGTQDSTTPGGSGGTTGNTVPEPAITGVKGSYTKNYKDRPFTLKAKGKGKLTYSTSNKKVAAVGKTNGKVTLKEIGRAIITIKSSDAALKIKIQVVPKKPSIQRTSAYGKKAFKLNWRKDSKVTGYQIQVSTSSKFKGSKTYTVKKNKTTSYTVKKLKSKKKYYVQMRSYKTVSGKKYYSSWSSKKTVKVK